MEQLFPQYPTTALHHPGRWVMSVVTTNLATRFCITSCLTFGIWAMSPQVGTTSPKPQEPAVQKVSAIQPLQAAASNAWNNLVPLHSSRQDVESKLGEPDLSLGFTSIYKTRKETVNVLFSAGCCELSKVERWNVPAGTVIRMVVTPRRTVLVRNLHLDREYVRIKEAHPENWIMYWNTERGIMVHAVLNNGREEVMSITYEPTAKDKSLYCPKG